MLSHLIGILFDGVALQALLFLISIGPAVTTAGVRQPCRGAFDAAGGYVCVLAMTRRTAVLRRARSSVRRRRACRRVVFDARSIAASTDADHLFQVLFTIGLVFMSIANVLPVRPRTTAGRAAGAYLTGQVRIGNSNVGAFRLFLIGVVALRLLDVADRAHALRRAGARLR